MANNGMTYQNEEEEADITLSGTSHVFTFANTGHAIVPKVEIDGWTGSSKPTVTITLTQVTIEGEDGDQGHLSIIDLD